MIRFRERASLCRTSLDLSVLAALQGCHFIITISGPSVALQLLITLSPSHRLAPSVGLEVSRAASRTRSSTLELPIHRGVTFVDSRDCHTYTYVDSRVPSPLVVTFVDSRDPLHVRWFSWCSRTGSSSHLRLLGHTGTLCTVLVVHTPEIVSCADALYSWRHLAFCLYVTSVPLPQVVFCACASACACACASACASARACRVQVQCRCRCMCCAGVASGSV